MVYPTGQGLHFGSLRPLFQAVLKDHATCPDIVGHESLKSKVHTIRRTGGIVNYL